MRQSSYEKENACYVILAQDQYDTDNNRERLSLAVMGSANGVSVLYNGRVNAVTIDYKQIFALDAEKVCGIAFSRKWIQECGGLNAQLPTENFFEFLCRLVRVSGSCEVIMPEQIFDTYTNDEKSADAMAFIYAYIMRHHLNFLHKLKLTDIVFPEVCALMQQKDCFNQFQQYTNFFLTNEWEYERIAGYTAPFIILRGDDTCGGVLQQFADDLTKALIANDQAVIEIGEKDSDYDKLQGIVSKGVVGFQAAALEIDFFQKIHGPKFQFWFDNPLRFNGILRNLSEDNYILCQDADHAELIRKYYHTPNAIQFPPGGMEVTGKPAFHMQEDRPYDVIFMGRYFADDFDGLTTEQKEFYEYMLSHPLLTFEQGFFNLNGGVETCAEDVFIERMMELKPACRAVIGHFRNEVITAVLHAGITIHVYGETWNELLQLYPEYAGRLCIHPEVSMKDSLEEFRKAKIGLNIMSWYKSGMTERIANIMLSGAVCLSDETTYLKEHSVAGEEIELYSVNGIDKLPEQIYALLQDDTKRQKIALRGYRKAVEEFSWNARARQLIRLSERRMQKEKSLQIFVATHVAFNPPDDPLYVPLHVGKSGKPDLGYIGDNTGENISDLNFLYGELTGLYWIWHNVQGLDYVGLCHYRRYFIDDQMYQMKQGEYLRYLQECDAIVPKHMQCEDGCSYYEQFGRAHNIHDLDAVGRALKQSYPEYADAYDHAMNGTIFYYGNLMVTSLQILRAYAKWLFTIFVEAGEEIDVSGYDDYHKRVYGFLSEQMFYVFALANNLKLREVAVGVSAEKTETRELKEALRRLIAQNKIKEARILLEKQLKVRPDLLLPASDINHELRDICNQLL